MLSLLYYLFLIGLCTSFLILSAVALVLTWPFQRSRRIVHELSRALVRIFFFIPPLWRHRVIGREYIDPHKPYVIVINHRAMTDIPTLYFLPLNFRWVSKREVFKLPFFGQFLSIHGDICINRGRATEAMEQLIHKGKMWLGRGVSIAIFPEGTRSKDGEIHRFKAGAFTLAHEAGVEVLPVVMEGTTSIIRPNRMFNWRNRITIRILPPVSPAHITEIGIKEAANEIHDQMVDALNEIRNTKR